MTSNELRAKVAEEVPHAYDQESSYYCHGDDSRVGCDCDHSEHVDRIVELFEEHAKKLVAEKMDACWGKKWRRPDGE